MSDNQCSKCSVCGPNMSFPLIIMPVQISTSKNIVSEGYLNSSLFNYEMFKNAIYT